MGFPWKQVGKIGMGVGSAFIPGFEGLVNAIEEAHHDKPGDVKAVELENVAMAALPVLEGLTSRDFDDPTLKAAFNSLRDCYVASQNARAAYAAAIARFQAVVAMAKSAPRKDVA